MQARILCLLFSLFCWLSVTAHALESPCAQVAERVAMKMKVPEAAKKTLAYVKLHHEAPPGHVGGRRFGNFEKRLPKKTPQGKPIRYQEWDIYPKIPGKSRGPERLITGNDERAWYTPDHYATFTEIP